MKILFVQDSLGTGGAERSNAELWYYLKKKGVDLKIIVLEHRQEGVEDEIIQGGFDVIFLKRGNFINQVVQLRNLIKNFQPDIVHSVLFKATMRTRMALLKLRVYHVESLVNCSYADIRYKDPRVNSFLLRVYEKLDKYSSKFGVDHFLAITNEVKRHYQEQLKINPNKISVIYRGRDKNKYLRDKVRIRLEVTEELELQSKGLIFIHVGRQEFQKAHLDLLKAIRTRDQELYDAGARFLFCGRKGNASLEIEKFLASNNLKTPLYFLGHRNDVNKLLVASDVFVFPSLYEGLGGSLIEAQAASLPIICSNIPVFKEVVTKNNATFFATGNSIELGERLVEITKSEDKRAQMREKSLLNYQRKFRLNTINEATYQYYKQVI